MKLESHIKDQLKLIEEQMEPYEYQFDKGYAAALKWVLEQ